MSDLGGSMNENLRDKIAEALSQAYADVRDGGPDAPSPDTYVTDAVLAVVGPKLDRLRAEVANLRAALAKVDAVRSEMLGLQASGASLVSRQWVIYRLDAVLASVPEPSDSEPECTCPYTPEDQWLSAASCGYGSGYEPGSMQEFNPECPAHGYPSDSEPAPDADREAGER